MGKENFVRGIILLVLLVGVVFFVVEVVVATYAIDIYFTLPDSVYTTGERVELKGWIYFANYSSNGSLVSAYSVLPGSEVNLTVRATNGTYVNNYTLTSDQNGTFYSQSTYNATAPLVSAPSSAGDYYLRGEYKDPDNTTWFSEVEITVVNQSVDLLRVRTAQANYNPSESVIVEVEAIKRVGGRILYVANISVNGSLRDSERGEISTFNCTTGSNGKCTTTLTAPSDYGQYFIELNDFRTYTSFSVVPFSFNVYMKDELGQSLKNVFSVGNQARVEVGISNASDSDVYTFSGYIADSEGNVVKSITSTTLYINNSFTNSFLFTVDAVTFDYASYTASLNISKEGDGSMSATTSFKVEDWSLSVVKKSTQSGFEYGYNTFPNNTLNLEAYPTYRANGSIIPNVSASSFSVELKDNLDNVLSVTNASWNASCGSEGCYEFSFTSPADVGQYILSVTFAYSGSTQTVNHIINVIDSVVFAQSTDSEGSLKELFGTNEYVYLSLTSYNSTVSSVNLSDAELFSVRYMNGSEITYSNVSNFSLVNSSNGVAEWAWNSTSQRIKLDVPSIGGVYDVFIFGNNRSVGTVAKFIVNPYELCSVPKDTPGPVDSSNYFYVWQFKTTDTVYFELKITQANNPLGRATAQNSSSNDSAGVGRACTIDTSTQQVVENATVSVLEVRNLESGAIQSINSTESVCQASDNSGGYTCTVAPLSKWDGGLNSVKFRIRGQEGTLDVGYSRFEARAFYLYGHSQTWQNNPASNITLTVRLYEPGRSWWNGGGSGGLSGTISVRKVEYQGRDGEWIWPPITYDYNTSAINSSQVTSGSGSIALPAAHAPGGQWKTGNYRVVIQGTTTDGDTDYGYAWFGVKLWDAYGQPVECSAESCDYKSYFNSKENITLYIKISKSGAYDYYDSGGSDIFGNVSIGIKKIEDCRTWPCKELNTSLYSADPIYVNESSPWYWNAGLNNQSSYLLDINSTTGSWGTGYYSVVLDINGTDTGYAWFNTIAFYVGTRPVDENGTTYKRSIRGSVPMYFNITTTKGYQWGSYNESDFVNATLEDVSLRTWDELTYQSKEYNYPEDLNVTPLDVNGSALFNLSFSNGTWPTGYYWGEITFKNADNETSTGWLGFSVRPFRVYVSTSDSEVGVAQCINATISVYDPSWSSDTHYWGNYSIIGVYEDVWSMTSMSVVNYSNYTSGSFNATTTVTFCPNDGSWGSGSWGGYHYLRVIVKDNALNDSQAGWVSFRAIPFDVGWGSVVGGSIKLKEEAVTIPINLTQVSSEVSASGNLTRVYHRWRSDEHWTGEEDYVFKIGTCYSNVSGQCNLTGLGNLTIYPPSHGWRLGYDHFDTTWTPEDDSSTILRDFSDVYIEVREAYNGYFTNSDLSGYYKYEFVPTEGLTIKVSVRNNTYNSADVNITDVYYAEPSDTCSTEYCRTYTESDSWSIFGGGTETNNGSAIIVINSTSEWDGGEYYIKVTVSGDDGTASIIDGRVKVRSLVAPAVAIADPEVNQSITGTSFFIHATTSETSHCSVMMYNFDVFSSTYCGNATNSSNLTDANLIAICNATIYDFNGSEYYSSYISSNYYSITSGSNSSYWYSSSATGFTTDSTDHYYTYNTTNMVTGDFMEAQDYGLVVQCFDVDYNYNHTYSSISINVTLNSSETVPSVTINTPVNGTYYSAGENITFNFTTSEIAACSYYIDYNESIQRTYPMDTTDNLTFTATNTSIADRDYAVHPYCQDSSGNLNESEVANFTVDTTYPLVSYGGGTAVDGANLTQSSIYVNVSVVEINFNNITFSLQNDTAVVNNTLLTTPLYYLNWTSLVYTNYTYNISVYDFAGNVNSTDLRYVNLSAS